MKSTCQKTTFFLLNAKKWLKKDSFVSKKWFLQNVLTDTGRAVLRTSPGNFQQKAGNFSLNVNKGRDKSLQKCCLKNFYGHGASFLDDPVEKFKTKGLIFSTQRVTRNLSRLKTVTQRVPMLSTLRLQFRKPCQETFARRPKILLAVRKIWKRKRRFPNNFFPIMFLWPRNMRFWHPAKMFLSKIRKVLVQIQNWLENENFNFKIFSQKFWDLQKSNSFNSVEKLLPEDDNFFAQCQKMTEKRQFCLEKVIPSKMC